MKRSNSLKYYKSKLFCINHHLSKARIFKKTLFHSFKSLERNNFMQEIKKIIRVEFLWNTEIFNLSPYWTTLVPKTTKEKFSQTKIFLKDVIYSNFKIYGTTTYAKILKISSHQLFIKLEKPHFGSILFPLLPQKPRIKVSTEKSFELILKLILL